MNNNVAKTLNYMKKNGPVKTVYAIRERLSDRNLEYDYKPIKEEERLVQVADSLSMDVTFSILVPAYETNPVFLKNMIDSVKLQTYHKWQLVIADASSSPTVKQVVDSYTDQRICYLHLESNKGISENSNRGLDLVSGQYTGLLDHDDLLTPDALFRMATAITEARKNGICLKMLYSDEDKTDGENTRYFEPNIKPEFNLDLIMSNNYICHFLVLETALLKKIGFDSQYDGAQDHNLVLNAAAFIIKQGGSPKELIYHEEKVLYHWRCHEDSTAANPKSKLYAYQAGKRAVESFTAKMGYEAQVTDLPHMGFFRVNYIPDICSVRPEVGALCGRLVHKGKITGGIYNKDKKMFFAGLDLHNSGGYLHRAACQMEIPYADISAMDLSEKGKELLDKFLSTCPWENRDLDEEGARRLSFEFCDLLKREGLVLVYDPELVFKV